MVTTIRSDTTIEYHIDERRDGKDIPSQGKGRGLSEGVPINTALFWMKPFGCISFVASFICKDKDDLSEPGGNGKPLKRLMCFTEWEGVRGVVTDLQALRGIISSSLKKSHGDK